MGNSLISLAEFAKRLGVSRQTANSLDNGKFGPTLARALSIARLYDLPVEDIFEPDGEEPGEALATEERRAADDELRLAPASPARAPGHPISAQ